MHRRRTADAGEFGHPGVQRGDEVVGLVVGERLQLERVDQRATREALELARRHHHEHTTGAVREQRLNDVDRGAVEPVHVLGQHQCGAVAHTREQIVTNRTGDALLQLVSLGVDGPVAGVRGDAQHRREQGNDAGSIEGSCSFDLSGEQAKAFLGGREVSDSAAALQQPAQRVHADVGVKRRADDFEDFRACPLGETGGKAGQPALADARLAVHCNAGDRQLGRLGLGPAGLYVRDFVLPADERAQGHPRGVPFESDAIVLDRILDALDMLRRKGFEVELALHQSPYRLGDGDGSGRSETRHAGGEIGGEPVDVVLFGVEIHHAAVNSDTDVEADTETLPGAFVQLRDVLADLEPRADSAMCVVLVRHGVAEDRQQAVTLDRRDVPFVCIDGPAHMLLVPAHDRSVRLRVDLGRQRRGIDQIGEHDCQAADLAMVDGWGEQILGVRVGPVGRQHLTCQRVGGFAVSLADRLDGPVDELVDIGWIFGVHFASARVMACTSRVCDRTGRGRAGHWPPAGPT